MMQPTYTGVTDYFDPWEYEFPDAKYNLTVYVPERIPNIWRQCFSYISKPVNQNHKGYTKLGNNPAFEPTKPSYVLNKEDLEGMTKELVIIESRHFPLALRCSHVTRMDGNTECHEGCYLLESEGKRARLGPGWKCARKDCKGHRWEGLKKIEEAAGKNERGIRWCFGTKGKRMICIEAEF